MTDPLDAEEIQVLTIESNFTVDSVHEALFVTDAAGTGLDRFDDLLSLRRRVTPNRAEYAMFAAYGAALRSAALRGGVGAALVDTDGEVVALGTAEVPAGGGGQYWDGDNDDARDFVAGADPATAARTDTVVALLSVLATRLGVTLPEPAADTAATLLREFDADQGSLGVGHGRSAAQSFESLGRVVHAEMAALLSAARTGIAVSGHTLYVTALPCRQCLRHLVCAGLERVVYFGSRLPDPPVFHRDSVTTGPDEPRRLTLLPFTGVGPGAYPLLFTRQMRTFRQSRSRSS
ncbi:deoxycytidylate deaminase [Nocardia africana]|uniref:Deoxycytidylate deaminase n=1 Tax=Nocardia africana TaxID=134964 RepID=A0ABW6NF17_9NOCA